MTTTVSPKYQIVIPKAVRKQLGIKPGQKMEVQATDNGEIIVRQAEMRGSFAELEQYAGILQGVETAWGKEGIDPTEWIRRQRDQDWR